MLKEENLLVIKTDEITLIAIYMRPQATTEEIMEAIMSAITTADGGNMILAGDINCRIDKKNCKTEIIMEALEEEGFTLVNKRDMPTYIAHNGTSAIDLLLYKGQNMKVLEQKCLWTSSIAPLRKHIPVETRMSIITGRHGHKRNTADLSRHMDTDRLWQNIEKIEKAKEQIANGQLEAALEMANKLIRDACKPRTK